MIYCHIEWNPATKLTRLPLQFLFQTKSPLIKVHLGSCYRKIAPVARLELATRGLTVRCSNQLSYTGIVDSALRV